MPEKPGCAHCCGVLIGSSTFACNHCDAVLKTCADGGKVEEVDEDACKHRRLTKPDEDGYRECRECGQEGRSCV